MIWPFSKKKEAALLQKLLFKSGAAFFEYQCKYGHTEVKLKQGIVALVLDSSKEFGTGDAVKVEGDGRQLAMIQVASEDGGFIVPAYTPSEKGDRLKPDDVVIWVPIHYAKEAVQKMPGLDPRFGWIGFIVAKVKPQIDITSEEFQIICQYD